MQGKLKVRLLFAALALFWLCSEASAWGDKAHQVICGIAFKLVQQDTRVEIERLIAQDSKFKSFSDSCVFPDHPRIRAAEHFVNLARDAGGLATDACSKADTCVLSAIRTDTQILSSTSEDDLERLTALKSLGHGLATSISHFMFRSKMTGEEIRSARPVNAGICTLCGITAWCSIRLVQIWWTPWTSLLKR